MATHSIHFDMPWGEKLSEAIPHPTEADWILVRTFSMPADTFIIEAPPHTDRFLIEIQDERPDGLRFAYFYVRSPGI